MGRRGGIEEVGYMRRWRGGEEEEEEEEGEMGRK